MVRTERLGKRYLLGEGLGRTTLREALWQRLTAPGRPERESLWAVRDLDVSLRSGESVGLIGRNGAGKSTLLRLLARITEPTEGVARTRGRVAALLEVGTGLHPELTGHENIYLAGAILGMRRDRIASRYDEIVSFAEVDRFLDTPVKRYSSGMYLRLAFAVAAHLDADVLLVDEALAVGDADFQERCLGRMEELGEQGRTVLFTSHDLDAVSRLCSRTLWMDGGRLVADGPSDQVIATYLGHQEEHSGQRRLATDPSMPVAVSRVTIRSSGDRPTGVVSRQEPLVIEFDLDVRRVVRGAHLGATVTTSTGVRVLDEALELPDDADGVGRYRVRLNVPALLSPGGYSVGVWAGTAYEDHVWIEDAVAFRVVGDTDGRPDRVVQLTDPWRLERA